MILIIMLACSATAAAGAQATTNTDWQTTVQSIIGALDYVAIDYPEAVQAGQVVNEFEYAEQREFLQTVNELLALLPARPEQQALLADARELQLLVDQHAPSEQIASGSRSLVVALIEAYDVITAPVTAPDPGSVASLYAEQCSSCHGLSGHGDGIAGAALDPPPTDFHDAVRAQQRSLYGLYSTVTLGVTGTGMPSFSSLSEEKRWALAFYVAGLRDDPDLVAAGEQLWNDGVLRQSLGTLASFTSESPLEMSSWQEEAGPVLAYLRHHPEALVKSAVAPIQRTINGLQEMMAAYNRGQRDSARQLALSAYLEGYELVEAPLRTIDSKLAIGIERDMQVLRNMIRDGVPADELASSTAEVEIRLHEASALMASSGASNATLVTSAFIILLREGLEAILLLAAMSLYLRRTAHPTAMRYLHFGWLSALAVGALTWVGIKTVISISGAQREVVEGMAALLAAFVLLYVGIWLHRHSSATHWQTFLNERLGRNLTTGTLWGIAALAFIAVYREILETVLFYETLWLQSGTAMPLVVGASLAGVALLAVGWLVFRVGARLPLRRFFQANGVLMFVLAIIFAGKGVSALQEAGWIGVTFVQLPRIDWLGIYPTVQSVGAQAMIICIGTLWLIFQSQHKATAPGPSM